MRDIPDDGFHSKAKILIGPPYERFTNGILIPEYPGSFALGQDHSEWLFQGFVYISTYYIEVKHSKKICIACIIRFYFKDFIVLTHDGG